MASNDSIGKCGHSEQLIDVSLYYVLTMGSADTVAAELEQLLLDAIAVEY